MTFATASVDMPPGQTSTLFVVTPETIE